MIRGLVGKSLSTVIEGSLIIVVWVGILCPKFSHLRVS